MFDNNKLSFRNKMLLGIRWSKGTGDIRDKQRIN